MDATTKTANEQSDDYRDDCVFCKIVAGRIASTEVYEDDRVYAFKDINPKTAVHVLVVPKKHADNVAELAARDPETLADIVAVAQKIADDSFHGAYRLVFNTGKDAGQSVFHAHAHVLTGEVLPE
ncbi:MAG: histidine triad nucleotide-binding protein [Aeriscardovia sp.]|nr:histidine triad nucleotide-binding protein [Aeriscardovia sp.]